MSYSSVILGEPGLKAYYRMGESSGQPQDSSGNGNHTTVTGGTPSYGQPGALLTDPTATCILFTSAFTDYFTAPDSATLDCADNVTCEFWYKPVYIAAGQTNLLAKGLGAYGSSIVTRRVRLENDGNSGLVQSNQDLGDITKWYHWFGSKNGATRIVMVNGVDATQLITASTLADTTNVLTIGSDTIPPNCYMQEIAIYSPALPQARGLAHYVEAGYALTNEIGLSGEPFWS